MELQLGQYVLYVVVRDVGPVEPDLDPVFFWISITSTRGAFLFIFIWSASSSLIIMSSWLTMAASTTKTTRSDVFSALSTAFPPPTPLWASSIIPGISNIWMWESLYIMVPGIIVVVVKA